jgi:hypothetical protein
MRGSFIDFLDLEEDEGRSDFTEMPLSMKD